VIGSGWDICKSAHRSRQITTPATHRSVFYRLDALPGTQPTASKHLTWIQWRPKVQKSRIQRPHLATTDEELKRGHMETIEQHKNATKCIVSLQWAEEKVSSQASSKICPSLTNFTKLLCLKATTLSPKRPPFYLWITLSKINRF